MSYVTHTLGTNEKVVIHTRKHLIILLWPCCATLLSLSLIVVGVAAAVEYQPDFIEPLLAAALFPLCYLFYSFLKWWNEEYYVTTHRVIQAAGIFNKRIVDSSLEQVNDVVLGQSWIGRLLDLGDLEIMTASEIGVNKLTDLKSPLKFKSRMLDQKETLSSKEQEHQHVKAEGSASVTNIILDLEKLKDEGVLTEEEFQTKKKELLARI